MVVAVTVVAVMKVALDDIVGVIAVRNSFVTAAGTMYVISSVTCAAVTGAAIEMMLINVIAVLMMKMSIMKVVYVVTVLDGGMSAGVGMLVVMLVVCLTVAHYVLRFLCDYEFENRFRFHSQANDRRCHSAATLILYSAPKQRKSIACHHMRGAKPLP